MANYTSQVGFQSPSYDYAADETALQRSRDLAKALQAQAGTTQGTEVVNGWAVPQSPLAPLVKALQGGAAGYMNKQADEKQRDLAAKIQSDYRQMIAKGLGELQGTPAIPAPSDDMGGGPGRPAMAPNPMEAMATFGSHPMGQQFMPMAMQDLSRQQMIAALRGGQAQPATQGNPMASSGASVMAPGGGQPQAPQTQRGGPAFGIPMETWLQVDPTGKLYMEKLAEQGKPINVRPGGTVYIPGQGAQYTAPQNGMQTIYGAGGPSVGLMPGYSEAQTALHSIPNPSAPMQTVKLSNQRELQLTQPEYVQYTQSGGQVLPTRYQGLSQEIPGMKFQDAMQRGPVQQPPSPMPPGLQPIPGKVPPQDMPAFNAVASGQVPAAYGMGGQQPVQKPPERAVVGATQSQGEQVQQARQTAAGKAVDEQFGKDYVSFTTGGASDAAKQLSQLQDVARELENPKANLTGPMLGHVPDTVKNFTNPQSVAMRERVEEVVQRSLRAILGAQFTEKEGERLIARAYNPNLPESENAIRVNRLFTQLNQAFEAKQSAAKYFEQNGTLDGWRGRLPSISDFNPSPNMSSGKMGGAGIVDFGSLGRGR